MWSMSGWQGDQPDRNRGVPWGVLEVETGERTRGQVVEPPVHHRTDGG